MLGNERMVNIELPDDDGTRHVMSEIYKRNASAHIRLQRLKAFSDEQ